jgi:hypothetical protein
MKRIIRLTEKDLTRIVKRVIREQSTPSGVNPTLKPDFDTMKRTGTDSDASNNKFWKELKPEIERLTGKKFKQKQEETGGFMYGGNWSWMEDSLVMNNSGGGDLYLQYPASAVDAGSKNDGNFVRIQVSKPKMEVDITGNCFDISNLKVEHSDNKGSMEDGLYMVFVKVWCKKQILDLVKSGLN